MARIKVAGFMSLKSVDIALGRMTVFIGPQAQGKSLVLKLIHFFETVMNLAVNVYVADNVRLASLKKDSLARFEAYFPKYIWGTSAFQISYLDGDFEINITRRTERTNTPAEMSFGAKFEEQLKLAHDRYKKLRPKSEEFLLGYSARRRLLDTVLAENAPLARAGIEPVFIPASRSFFANVEKNIFALISSKFELDPLMAEFGTTLEATRRSMLFEESVRKGGRSTRRGAIRRRDWTSIINGDYIYDGDEESIETDGRRVRIANSSSGQQEVIPMLLVLHSYSLHEPNPYLLRRSTPGTSFLVEEPEAHLFPRAQKLVSSLLVEAMNRAPTNRVIFTTHSPYMLTAINNLNLAGRIVPDATGKEKRRLLAKFPPLRQIAPGHLAAYRVDGGSVDSILDPETGLVNGMLIDEVSMEFAEEFDELLSHRSSK